MKYAVKMASCGIIYVHTKFHKIGAGVQAVLRFCFRDFRGFNVGITDGRDLRTTPLRWTQMP
jgi:hypothetical protein